MHVLPNGLQMFFPEEYQDHKYNLIHFNFFVQYAKVSGVEVLLQPSNKQVWISNDSLIWSCLIDGQQVIFDYADHWHRDWKKQYPDLPYFKFQKTSNSNPDCLALGPPMVGIKRKGNKGATLREYMKLKWDYNYTPGNRILSKQLPNGAAVARRNTVHMMLQDNFKDVDTSADVDQIDFWKMHEDCLVSVCVPGATNNMVDRGQIELIGLGVCTVSPKLDTLFPWEQCLIPDQHYIQCKDDYSDLVDIIHWLQEDKEICKKIGHNAQQFYDSVYSPPAYWRWIMETLGT